MANTRLVDLLVEAAQTQRIAEVHYRKKVASSRLQPRFVEPYHFKQGKQDLLIHCFQLQPEPGWRFFMAHRLDHVELTTDSFEPRRRITLPGGVVDTEWDVNPVWTDGLCAYRDLVSDAIADGIVTQLELGEIRTLTAQHELEPSGTRFVHASIFHRCLGAILDDGVVTEEEMKQIRFLNRVMQALGWGILDKAG